MPIYFLCRIVPAVFLFVLLVSSPANVQSQRAPDSYQQIARDSRYPTNWWTPLAKENMKKMGISWVTFAGKRIEYRSQTPGEHYRLIVAATQAKVKQNPEVKKVLLATGDLILKPDHRQGPNPPPAWRYYDILTQ